MSVQPANGDGSRNTSEDGVRRDAMDVVLTWGPERITPEPDRLIARHPDLDTAAAEDAVAECHRIMSKAAGLAPEIKGIGPATTSRGEIMREHPWLTDELLSRAIQQGLYNHWRDTGV